MDAPKRKLPIGIQTFRKMREEDCYYVDKTSYVRRLVDEGSHYFLSRPRRFGKSLFLDTLKELFEGNEALFEGLDIHGRRDWSIRHPVLRFSFGAGDFGQSGFLEASCMEKLAAAEVEAGVSTEYATASGRFAALLAALHRRTGQRVVVLVDEYDKPILDALDEPDVARANRNFLRGFYSVVKDSDAHVQFTFITGVSRSLQRGCARGHPSHETASRVSLFSGLNNLRDITLDPRYSAICGYTDADLDTVFAPELPGLDREAIRRWYNGYGWLGAERVYNPFDILLLFDSRRFAAHWFETGTPTFLIETLVERGVGSFALDGMAGTDELLSTFDVGDMAIEALLFQTGYLTIRDHEHAGGRTVYRLGYPNQEVRQSLNDSLSRYLSGNPTCQTANSVRLHELLKANDFGLQRNSRLNTDSGSLHFDVHAEVPQTPKEVLLDAIGVAVREVSTAEVVVIRLVAEHEVGSGQHGGGDRHDGLLRAATALEAPILGLQIAAVLPARRPRGLDQRRLQPGGRVTEPGRAALARTLVEARA